MKTLLMLALLMPCVAAAQSAPVRKSCDELKNEIAVKIERNGVKAYTLETMDAGAATDAKIVGRCNGGTRLITYRRGENPATQNSVRQVAAAADH